MGYLGWAAAFRLEFDHLAAVQNASDMSVLYSDSRKRPIGRSLHTDVVAKAFLF